MTKQTIAMDPEAAEALSLELSQSVHCGKPFHRAVNDALSEAHAATICNDVFLNVGDAEREMMDFLEIKYFAMAPRPPR